MQLPAIIKAKDGHRFRLYHIPPFRTVGIDLLLNRGQTRKIAVINMSTKTLYVKRSTKPHLHRKMNSFGFNYEIISNQIFPFDQVHLTVDKKKKYLISRSFIIENGQFLHHKKEGFELQIFLDINFLNQFICKTTSSTSV